MYLYAADEKARVTHDRREPGLPGPRRQHPLLRLLRLKGKEQTLYQRVFRALTPREFLRLLRVGRFRDADIGERLAAQGAEGIDMMLIVRGRSEVRVEGQVVAELREGQFVGEMSFLTDRAASADVVAAEPTRYVSWPREELRQFLKKDPTLLAAMRLVIGTDLVAKLSPDRAGQKAQIATDVLISSSGLKITETDDGISIESGDGSVETIPTQPPTVRRQ